MMPFGLPFMPPPPAIPEHLRCDKTAFSLGEETRKVDGISYQMIEPLNPLMKQYGENLFGRKFANNLTDLDDKNRTFFYQEVQMLWLLRAERTVAKLLSFAGEPAVVITTHYPLGHLDRFISDGTHAITKKIAFYFICDIVRTVNIVHFTGHALRAFDLSGFFVEKEMFPQTGRDFFAIFSNFRASLPLNMEGLAQQAFADVEVTENTVGYIAPEIFEARAGRPPAGNHAAILRAADVYGIAILIATILTRRLSSFQ